MAIRGRTIRVPVFAGRRVSRRRAAAAAVLAAALVSGGCWRPFYEMTTPVCELKIPPDVPASEEPTGLDPSVPIEGFARVDDGLFRGAQPDAEGFRALHALGVRTVVNLRSLHADEAQDVPAGMDVVSIPMHAFVDSDPPSDEDLRRFFTVVLDPARRPVFVHCAQGKDRTGTMCALYRMEVQGWSNERALEEMRNMGFHGIYGDLERFVRDYRPRGFAAAGPR